MPRSSTDPVRRYGGWQDQAISDKATVAWLVVTPLVVVATLAWTENVLTTFVVYHVVLCLVAPAIDSLVFQDRSVAEHLAYIGLRPGADGSLTAGVGLGLLMFVGAVAPFLVAGDVLLGQADLAATVADWGLSPDAKIGLFLYMLVFNTAAEELFWRGHLHQRMAGWERRELAVGAVAVAFASYHLYTTYNLTESLRVASVLTLGIFFAALLWAVLREHYDTAFPAILAHLGATAGYMTIYLLWV